MKEGKASEQSQSGRGLLITGSSLQLYLGLGEKKMVRASGGMKNKTLKTERKVGALPACVTQIRQGMIKQEKVIEKSFC